MVTLYSCTAQMYVLLKDGPSQCVAISIKCFVMSLLPFPVRDEMKKIIINKKGLLSSYKLEPALTKDFFFLSSCYSRFVCINKRSNNLDKVKERKNELIN